MPPTAPPEAPNPTTQAPSSRPQPSRSLRAATSESHNSHSSHSSHPQPHESSHNTQSTANLPPLNNEERGTKNEELPSSTKNEEPPFSTIGGLAELLGTDRPTIRSYLLRLNLPIHTRRVGPRHKRVACLTAAQAAAITSAYHADLALGPEIPDETNNDPAIEPNPIQPDRNLGVVYLLQLEPDLDPGRYKVGFSHKPWQRLNDLLTVAPLAQCLAMWPARRAWERTAIEAISQTSIQIREEVYRATHIHEALAAGERFFASLPVPKACSPSSSSSSSSSKRPTNEQPPIARGSPPSRQRVPKGVEAALPTASREPPDRAPDVTKRLGVPPQTSRCGQVEGGAEQPSPARASRASPEPIRAPHSSTSASARATQNRTAAPG